MARKAERLLSIIVPVYNVEEYLADFVESVLDCSGFSYELIFVVRASQDQSLSIAESYVKKHPDCLRILYQQGDGLSNARNYGLQHARGQYIAFFDSDDVIQGELFSAKICLLAEQGEKPDIIISDYRIIGERGETISVQDSIEENIPFQDKGYLGRFLDRRRNYWNIWQYIFRRDFLLDCSLLFMEGVYSEDIEFSTRALLLTEKILFSHTPYYCYRIGRKGSLASAVTLKHIRDLMHILEVSVGNVEKSKGYPYQNQLLARLTLQYILSFVMIYDVDRMERNEGSRLINDKLHIFYPLMQKNKKFKLVCCLGMRNTARILNIVRYIRRIFLGIH